MASHASTTSLAVGGLAALAVGALVNHADAPEAFLASAPVSDETLRALNAWVCRLAAQTYLDRASKLPSAGAKPACSLVAGGASAVAAAVAGIKVLRPETRQALAAAAGSVCAALDDYVRTQHCSASGAIKDVSALRADLGALLSSL